jgi:hypothetical protein
LLRQAEALIRVLNLPTLASEEVRVVVLLSQLDFLELLQEAAVLNRRTSIPLEGQLVVAALLVHISAQLRQAQETLQFFQLETRQQLRVVDPVQ